MAPFALYCRREKVSEKSSQLPVAELPLYCVSDPHLSPHSLPMACRCSSMCWLRVGRYASCPHVSRIPVGGWTAFAYGLFDLFDAAQSASLSLYVDGALLSVRTALPLLVNSWHLYLWSGRWVLARCGQARCGRGCGVEHQEEVMGSERRMLLLVVGASSIVFSRLGAVCCFNLAS